MSHRIELSMAATLALAVVACAEPPGACDPAVAVATDFYRGCVAKLGLELTHFELSPDGGIDLGFADGTTDEQATRALEQCEPTMQVLFDATNQACAYLDDSTPASIDTLTSRIDAATRAGFSGSVSIVRDGALVLEVGRGLADRDAKVECAPGTVFDFGSMMKDFIGLALLDLAAAGELRFDDPVGKWLEAPADKSNITLAQLLDHSSGLQAYHDELGDFEPLVRDDAVARIFAQSLLFKPGTARSYSNSAYTLLAVIIERATGQELGPFLRARYDARGFLDSGVYGDALWSRQEVAVGYGAMTHSSRNSPWDWDAPSWALVGNGGLVSTVRDVDAALAFATDATAPAFGSHAHLPTLCLQNARVSSMSGGGEFGFAAAGVAVGELGLRVVVASNDNEAYSPARLAAELVMVASGRYLDAGARCDPAISR